MRKLFECFPQGSPMYVVLHAQYRRSRGRRPVATSTTERNPRCALQEAEITIAKPAMFLTHLAKPCAAETVKMAMDRVGLRFPTQQELEALLKNQPVVKPEHFPRIGRREGVLSELASSGSWDDKSHFCFVS